MQFKHTVSLFTTNLSLSYKVLILIFVVYIIAAAIFVSIIDPLLDGLFNVLQFEGLSLLLRDIIQNPVDKLSEIWTISRNFLSDNIGMLVSRLLYLGLLLVMVRFFISISLTPISKMIFTKMTSGYSNGLFSNLIASLLPSLGYAFFSSIIFALADIGLFFLCLSLFFWLYKLIKIGSLLFVFAFFIIVFSIRIALFSQWLSVICDGQRNIFKALVEGVKLSLASFKDYFPIILTFVAVYITIFTTSAFTTFGVLPIITLPMFLILYCTANLTCYFDLKNKKYYIDDGITVYDPTTRLKNKK